jgi:hypothetical protein
VALPTKHDPVTKITLTVALDGDRADIAIEPSRTFGDVIRKALDVLGVDESANTCHLAGYSRLYFHYHRIDDADVEDGTVLRLRLPL